MSAKRVLLVEDEPDVLSFMALGLQGAGFDVALAANGRQALELQRSRVADVVVTDIFMPDMDGLETIDWISRQYPRTRILAISGGVRGMQDYLKVARAIGADETLVKPFTTSDLVRLVRFLADKPQDHT